MVLADIYGGVERSVLLCLCEYILWDKEPATSLPLYVLAKIVLYYMEGA